MKPFVLALAAVLTVSPALAGSWEEGSFLDLSGRIFDEGGVKVSNCHLESRQLVGLEAVPKCYVLNTSGKPAAVRIEFVVIDAAGAPVTSATLVTPFPLQDMHGAEFTQSVPVSADEAKRVKRARIRVTAVPT